MARTKVRKRSQDELIRLYGPEKLERANRLAAEKGVKDQFAYVTKVLASWGESDEPERTGDMRNGTPSKKLRCDNCKRSTWLGDLVVRLGFAICTGRGGCLVMPQDVLDAEVGEWPLTATAKKL